MSDADQERSPAKSVQHDLSGRQLGDYRLLRRLGLGAMAEVYLAEQCSLGRQVALKVLKPDLAEDETYVKRFQREARSAASLVHANIVQIHEVGQIQGFYFIAQEYVQGMNLRQWIARNGTPNLRLALIVMYQAAAALSKAAEQGIVHRDIKPENIMLTRSGEVKVADFGLARVVKATDGVDLTQAGMTMGTPLYMSPEQVEGRSLDPRSDLYSLGVTCYHMLAGSPPFAGETALSVAIQHINKPPVPLENIRADLPPALCRIIHKMLAKNPDRRYASARELLRDLRQVQTEHLGDEWPENLPGLDSLGIDLTTVTPIGEATQRLQTVMKSGAARPTRQWHWALWAGASLTACLLGGAAAYFWLLEEPLLARAEDRPLSVPPQGSVISQWLYAWTVDTEDAWRAVIDYFEGAEPGFHISAKKQLARKYVDQLDDLAAMEIFEEFASLDDSQPELRAWGLAGKCWILTRQKKHEESGHVYAQFWPIRDELKDPWMRQLLSYAVPTDKSNQPENPTRGAGTGGEGQSQATVTSPSGSATN